MSGGASVRRESAQTGKALSGVAVAVMIGARRGSGGGGDVAVGGSVVLAYTPSSRASRVAVGCGEVHHCPSRRHFACRHHNIATATANPAHNHASA